MPTQIEPFPLTSGSLICTRTLGTRGKKDTPLQILLPHSASPTSTVLSQPVSAVRPQHATLRDVINSLHPEHKPWIYAQQLCTRSKQIFSAEE